MRISNCWVFSIKWYLVYFYYLNRGLVNIVKEGLERILKLEEEVGLFKIVFLI